MTWSARFPISGLVLAVAAIVLLFVIPTVIGCDSAGAGDNAGGGDITEGDSGGSPADAASALDALFSTIGVHIIGYEAGGLAGVEATEFVSVGGVGTQSFTFAGAVDPLTGYTLSGSITNTVTEPPAAATTTIATAGTITLADAPVTELVLDSAFVLDPVNCTMTQTGTLTVDGTAYDFSTLDITAGKAGEHLPRIMGVWKGSDMPAAHPGLPSFVGFGLSGNFLLPFSYDETEGAYISSGSPVGMKYDPAEKMFVSNDGGFWKSSGGFSADGNTMTLSSGLEAGGMIWVYRAGDAETTVDAWWQGTWNHEAFFNFGEFPEYNDFTFNFSLSNVAEPGTVSYNGYMFAASLDPENRIDGSATMSVDSLAGTITLSGATGGVPDGTYTYTTMGEFLVIGGTADPAPDPRIFVLERQ